MGGPRSGRCPTLDPDGGQGGGAATSTTAATIVKITARSRGVRPRLPFGVVSAGPAPMIRSSSVTGAVRAGTSPTGRRRRAARSSAPLFPAS